MVIEVSLKKGAALNLGLGCLRLAIECSELIPEWQQEDRRKIERRLRRMVKQLRVAVEVRQA